MYNQLRTVILFALLTALFAAAGAAHSPTLAWGFALLALLINGAVCLFSDTIILRMHGAKPVTRLELPGLYRMVEELSNRAGIPMPRIFTIDTPQPNAFATGRSPSSGIVVFTTGLIERVSERELRAVAAHELSHISHGDVLIASIAVVLASSISGVVSTSQFGKTYMGSRSDRSGPLMAFVYAVLAPLAATILRFAVSPTREYLADERAAKICGDAEGLSLALHHINEFAEYTPPATNSYAAASLFIVNPFTALRRGVLLKIFTTHPPVEDRILRLQALMRCCQPLSATVARQAVRFG